MGARGARVTLCGVALLCALAQAERPAGSPSCGPGRLLRGTGMDARCCRLCSPAEEVCPEGDCTCIQPEFHCGDPQCGTCKHHRCPPGQEARPSDACPGMGHTWAVIYAGSWSCRNQRPLFNGEGNFNFGFECVDCVTGTFSGGHEGRCKPWADCSQFGLPTAFPGNKTHNAVCSLGLPPAEPPDPLTAALLPVAACILVLTAAQFGLHLWQLRRQRTRPPETQLLLEAGPPAEDACSCQFPEEERGEQLPEDKGQLRDLWV